MRDGIRAGLTVTAIVLASAVTMSVDPPDLQVNAVSGRIETVDATWSGSNYNVRYTQFMSNGDETTSSLITTNSANDVDPRIAITATGDALVAWWRDLSTDALVYRKRTLATGSWGPERLAGLAAESNSHPRIIYAGDKTWLVYQIQSSKSARSIGAQIIDDDPEPIRSIVSTTTYAGNLDVQIEYEARHLWVTWIDSASNVGYAEYDYVRHAWTSVARESYASDSVAAARDRIRALILGS
jgi:hypothetical protein